MIPWQRVETTPLPAAPAPRGAPPQVAELALWQRGEELAIRIGGNELMNSRQHHSEDELGRLACAHLTRGHVAHILIGGLGMGFTLRAVLDAVGPKATVEVAELIPAVVRWNRGVLAPLAGRPLDDKRVRLIEADVGTRMNREAAWDAILLDVDNGPAALTAAGNQRLYDTSGLKAVFHALRPGGVLAVWSATDDPRFSKRLRSADFDVLRHHVRARPNAGAIHVLSIATKAAEARGLMRPEAAVPDARRRAGGERPGGARPGSAGGARPGGARPSSAGRPSGRPGGDARSSSGSAAGGPAPGRPPRRPAG